MEIKYLKMKHGLTGRTKEEQIQKQSGEEFRTHIMRYGTILTDDSREDETGCYRDIVCHINGMLADVSMKNGHVTSWGVSSYDYFKTENTNDRLIEMKSQYRLIKK